MTRLTGWLVAVSMLASPLPALANGSSFNAAEIERAIVEYYGFFNAGTAEAPGPLSDIDKLELADALADMVAITKPETFNDILGHLLADYRHHADRRGAIEALLSRCQQKIAAELQEDRERHPALTVLDGALKAFTAAYFFGFGKGLWQSRGQGLSRLERFGKAMKAGTARVWGRRNVLIIGGAGSAAGLLHAAYEHLQTRKLDPIAQLSSIQAEALLDIGTRVAAWRDELRGLSQDARLLERGAAARARLTEIEGEVSGAAREVEHLAQAAPQFRSRMQPIAEDISEIRTLISRLGMRLDVSEFDQGLRP